MAWVEEESNIKFLCWGKLKEGFTKDDAVVVKKGEHIKGTINRITIIKTDDGDIDNIKYHLLVKDEPKEILVWSNAAIKRQHLNLELKEGDKVRFTYVDDYETSFGQKGRNVRVAVDR